MPSLRTAIRLAELTGTKDNAIRAKRRIPARVSIRPRGIILFSGGRRITNGRHGDGVSREPAAAAPRIGLDGNRLIAGLPPAELDALHHSAEQVRFRLRQVLFEPADPLAHVYFPLSAVFSVQTRMRDQRIAEALMVGAEGMLGLPAALGTRHMHSRVVCLLAGSVIRVPAAVVAATPRNGVLFARMLEYTGACLTSLSQLVACNGLHTAQQRYARWLLTMHDRAGADEFPITQEFLSQLLGLTRPTVSVVALEFQASGFIHYAQGRLMIDDRAGLEHISCECYRVIRDTLDGHDAQDVL